MVKKPHKNALLVQMTDAIVNGEYPNIHSVLISSKGDLLYEEYFEGEDEIYGEKIGVVKNSKDYLHDVRSISKVVVSTCVGIAIDQGKIQDVNQRVVDFFPSYPLLQTEWGSILTIEHLLTMTSGMIWNEPVPFNDPTNSEVVMINSKDPIEFVLSSEIDIKPGTQWRYNGGNTQVLAAIIELECQMPLDKFAQKYLFSVLEIKDYEWIKCPGSGISAAASGLRLNSMGLLNLGKLYLNHGKWNNTQIVSESWVRNSLKSQIDRSKTEGYSYAFWLWSETIEDKEHCFIAAPGNGDQRIYIDLKHDLVVAVTAGNYDNWDIANNSYGFLKKYILPIFQ